MTPFSTKRRRARALLAAMALAMAAPAGTIGAHPAHPRPSTEFVTIAGTAPAGTDAIALIDSGQAFDDATFQGLPDGIGVMPVQNGKRYVDMYVVFEQSHIPFGLTNTSVFADLQDSSIQRVRLDLETQKIVALDEVLPASAGLIRFCSATMVGPAEGFDAYTFLFNEESNDRLPVPAGAPYGIDSAISPLRQAGYSGWLDTKSGAYKLVPGMGRHNHENQVVVPGGWAETVSVSGDDTFDAPSSQLYMYKAKSPGALKNDKGTLYAFQVTGADGVALTESQIANPMNDLNDYLEVSQAHSYQGRFITVPSGVANGTVSYGVDLSGNPNAPQQSLEAWSNDHNVFQFVRVEDIGYDPDNPRTIYFADTGTTRLTESATTGRLFRAGSSAFPYFNSDGRIFKMTFNEDDPTVVDSLSIVAQGRIREQTGTSTFGADLDPNYIVGLVNPDNVAVGHDSLMVQEDSSSGNGIWKYDFGSTWTLIATTLASQPADVETSGIVDMSAWLGAGWWAFDVQAHGVHVVGPTPSTGGPADWIPWTPYWSGAPPIPGGNKYRTHMEGGQLLLLYVPES